MYNEFLRKSRKDRVCDTCHQTIFKDELYIRTSGIWVGDFFDHSWHFECYNDQLDSGESEFFDKSRPDYRLTNLGMLLAWRHSKFNMADRVRIQRYIRPIPNCNQLL